MNTDIIREISNELNVEEKYIEVTLSLLEEGNTVPFIARYRKEKTGELDEVAIRDIYDNEIPALRKKNTSQDASISALQTKDTEHDEAIEALQTEVADMVVIKTGSYVGNSIAHSNGESSRENVLLIDMNVERIIISDSSFDENSVNDVVIIKDAQLSTSETPSLDGINAAWASPYRFIIPSFKFTGTPDLNPGHASVDETGTSHVHAIAYNWENPSNGVTKISLCDLINIDRRNSMFKASNCSTQEPKILNRPGVTYQWIAFGTKS